MNVFISYSAQDTGIVKEIAEAVSDCNDEVSWWQESRRPGKDAWPLIFEWVEEADLVLAVITDKTIHRAMAVGNEIGYAKAKGITVIPILGEGVEADSLGCLIGLTHIRLRKGRLEDSINEVLDALDDEEGSMRKRNFLRLLTAIAAGSAIKRLLEK